MGIFLKLLGLSKYRVNPARIARAVLPFSAILGFAVAGMSIAFTWTIGRTMRGNWGLVNAIFMTVIWVIAGLAIALGIPLALWMIGHRINDALAGADGKKRVKSKTVGGIDTDKPTRPK